MAKSNRARKSKPPPSLVAMLGNQTVWSESDWFVRHDRPKCLPGCQCGCVRPIAVQRIAGVYPVEQEPWPIRSRYQADRSDCPNGCKSRDLDHEQELRLDRLCLRCLCHTSDPRWGSRVYLLMKGLAARRDAERKRLAKVKRAAKPSKQGRRRPKPQP